MVRMSAMSMISQIAMTMRDENHQNDCDQNNQNDRNTYPIRNSGNVLVKVPYNRMNEEMLRISRLGGQIVSIRPIGAVNDQPPTEHEHHEN